MSEIELKKRRAQQRLQMEAARTAGGWMPWACAVLALLWWSGAAAFLIGRMGWAEVAALPPLVSGGAAAIAFAPGVALVLAGVMARESVRSREASAVMLTAAREMLAPAETAQNGVESLVGAIAKQTQLVNENLESAHQQVSELKTAIETGARDAAKASETVRMDAETVSTRLREEQEGMREVGQLLESQSTALAQAIPKHAHAMSEAAKLAQSEVEKADAALDQRLESMDSAGKRLAEHIAKLDQMAADSRKRAQNLVAALVRIDEQMLSSSKRVDSAIQAGTLASEASRGTADALHEAIAASLDDARKAADEIRAGADAAHREASAAITRLKEAGAEAETTAKAASLAARSQAEDTEARIRELSDHLYQAASRATQVAEAGLDQARERIERASNLLNGLDQPPSAAPPAAPPPRSNTDAPDAKASLEELFEPEPASPANAPTPSAPSQASPSNPPQPANGAPLNDPAKPNGRGVSGFDKFLQPPPQIPNPSSPAQTNGDAAKAENDASAHSPAEPPAAEPAPNTSQQPPRASGANGEEAVSWRDFLAGIDDPERREEEAAAMVERLNGAGIKLKKAVRASDLRRIAAASSRGERQRRRAIRDAAPGELQQIIQVLKQDLELRGKAESFLAMEEPDALKHLEGAERARDDAAPRLSAYLLIDAALS